MWREIQPKEQFPAEIDLYTLEQYVIVKKRNAQDSGVGYAARLLTIINALRIICQQDGRTLDACLFAYQLGELHREWQLKAVWDRRAMLQKKRETNRRKSIKRVNSSKKSTARKNKDLARSIEAEILKVNPRLTRRARAKIVRTRIGNDLKLSTIETYLKNKE